MSKLDKIRKLRSIRARKLDRALSAAAQARQQISAREEDLARSMDHYRVVMAKGGLELVHLMHAAEHIVDPQSRFVAVQRSFNRQREQEDQAHYMRNEAEGALEQARDHLRSMQSLVRHSNGRLTAVGSLETELKSEQIKEDEARDEETAADAHSAMTVAQQNRTRR